MTTLNVTARVDGLDRLIRQAQEAARSAVKEIKRANREGANLLRQEERKRAPKRIGRKIRTQFGGRGAEVWGKVKQGHPLAQIFENGARPHGIRSRRGKGLLVFQAGGRTVYARQVRHPGMRPRTFVQPALRASLSRIEGFYHDAAERIAQTIAG